MSSPNRSSPSRATTPPKRDATGAGRANARPRPSRDIKRKPLTKKLERFLVNAQMDALGVPRCGCGCGDRLEKKRIGEHWHCVALGNKERPDALLNAACAYRKTYGGQDGDNWRAVGGDTRDIKHIRKLAEKRTQHDKRLENGPKLKSKSKLQGAGFRKDIRRTMRGTVEPRSR